MGGEALVTERSAEVRVGSQGRIVLPLELRRELGAEEGAVYTAHVDEDGRLILESRQALLRRMQQEARAAAGSRSPLQELLDERRREAAGESGQ